MKKYENKLIDFAIATGSKIEEMIEGDLYIEYKVNLGDEVELIIVIGDAINNSVELCSYPFIVEFKADTRKERGFSDDVRYSERKSQAISKLEAALNLYELKNKSI